MPETIPYETPDPRKVADDLYQLKALTICQFVFAGVALFAIPSAVITGSWFVMTILGTYGMMQLVSGICMHQRKWRKLTIVVSAINCALFPLGTIFGGATINLLNRPAIMEIYRNHEN